MIENNQQNNELVTEDLEHVDRCLSMILHHKEVQQIANVIRKIVSEESNHQSDREDEKL